MIPPKCIKGKSLDVYPIGVPDVSVTSVSMAIVTCDGARLKIRAVIELVFLSVVVLAFRQ